MQNLTHAYLSTIPTESTRNQRRKHLHLFFKWLRGHGLSVEQTTPEHLRNYKKFLSLTRHCKSRTVGSYFQTLRKFFDWLVERGEVQESPVSEVETKRRNITQVSLSDDQLRTLGQKYLTHALRDWLLFSLMVLPGLTPGEVVNIRMSDVRFDRVPRIILGKDTLICINPEILPVLKQYLRCFPRGEFLFHESDGPKLSP